METCFLVVVNRKKDSVKIIVLRRNRKVKWENFYYELVCKLAKTNEFFCFISVKITPTCVEEAAPVETFYMEATKTKLQKLNSSDSTKSYYSAVSLNSTTSKEQDFISVCSENSLPSS